MSKRREQHLSNSWKSFLVSQNQSLNESIIYHNSAFTIIKNNPTRFQASFFATIQLLDQLDINITIRHLKLSHNFILTLIFSSHTLIIKTLLILLIYRLKYLFEPFLALWN